MGVFTQVGASELAAYLGGYGAAFVGARVDPVPAGSVNSNFAVARRDGARFFLRVYEEQDARGAKVEADLLAHLAERGVPAVPPIDGAVGTLAGKPAALFPWRAGDMRCQHGVTVADAFRVGEALARVHREGAGASVPASRFRPQDLLVRLDRVAAAPDPTLAAHAAPLRQALARWNDARVQGLPRGVVHGDLFRDNVLWSADGSIAALLDFESASEGVFAYDLMVTILAWCVGDALNPDLARAMVGGYRAQRELEAAERAGLLAEGCLAAARFTITRITDYAMRAGVGPRVMKDWRRFAMRLRALEAMGAKDMARTLGLD